MKFILTDVDSTDFLLAGRAIRFLMDQPNRKDAILQYGEIWDGLTLYVRRGQASITIKNITQPPKGSAR